MKLAALATVTAIFLASVSPLSAKMYHVVVPTNPGSTHDVIARSVINAVKNKDTENEYIVENVFGVSGDLGLERTMKYAKEKIPVIYFAFDGTFAFNPHNKPPLAFDRMDSVIFLQPTIVNSETLVVRSSLNINTVKELVDYAKTKKDGILVGIVADMSQVANHKFMASNNFNGVVVKYRTVPDLLLALQRGDIDYTFTSVNPTFQTTNAVKILATTSPQRSKQLPDVPTFKELGYPELVIENHHIWSVPKDQKEDAASLEKKLKEASDDASVKKVFDTFIININQDVDTDKKIRDLFKSEGEDYKIMIESEKK